MRRDRLPHTLLSGTHPPGAPLRVAFVGDPAAFGPYVPDAPAGGIAPALVAPEDAGETLRALDPHVVVAFRPEALAAAFWDAVDALGAPPVLGVVTEPLPRADREPHPVYDANLEALGRLPAARVARVITTDANSWDAAAALGLPLWRALPLPVADRFYAAPRRTARPPRVLVLGAATEHREAVLSGLRDDFGAAIDHRGAAPDADALQAALAGADAGLNVHAERWIRAFEPSVLLHLAAGHLVITEVLEPLYGLEPGLDVVMAGDHYELDLRIHQLFQTPEMYDRVRLRGHHKSRQHRASLVWPRVVGDLLADLAAFG